MFNHNDLKHNNQNSNNNPFELLDISPVKFIIDNDILEKSYNKKQLQFHPDKFISDSEKLYAIQISADINSAYETLKDPYKRAIAILKLYNFDFNEHITTDNKTLMEIFQIREKIENTKCKKELSSLQQENQNHMQKVIDKMENLLEKSELNQFAKNANLYRYLQKLDDEIGTKLYDTE